MYSIANIYARRKGKDTNPKRARAKIIKKWEKRKVTYLSSQRLAEKSRWIAWSSTSPVVEEVVVVVEAGAAVPVLSSVVRVSATVVVVAPPPRR